MPKIAVMKTTVYAFTLFFLLPILAVTGCKKNGTSGDDRPVFSYTEPIINPPDEFLVVFNTSIVGDRIALISFENDNVWEIEKLGDGRISFFIGNDSVNHPITLLDTLGLKSDKTYELIVSNIYTSEFNNFFVGFTKLDTTYADFEPKF